LVGADTLAEVQRRGLAVEHTLYAETLAALLTTNSLAGTSSLPLRN
jgi:hypothetical protein